MNRHRDNKVYEVQMETRTKFGRAVVLQPDGSNFLIWQCMIPGYMAGETNAWDVIQEIIPEDATNAEWKKGNYNAKSVLYQTVSPELITTLFYTNSESITALSM